MRRILSPCAVSAPQPWHAAFGCAGGHRTSRARQQSHGTTCAPQPEQRSCTRDPPCTGCSYTGHKPLGIPADGVPWAMEFIHCMLQEGLRHENSADGLMSSQATKLLSLSHPLHPGEVRIPCCRCAVRSSIYKFSFAPFPTILM